MIATDDAMKNLVAGTPIVTTDSSFSLDSPLEPGTYYWSVRILQPKIGPVSRSVFTVEKSSQDK